MNRTIERLPLLAFLAILGLTLAITPESRAAPAAPNSITISGGLVQGPGGSDPPYIYVFDVYLTSGYIAPGINGFSEFTIDGLVGVDHNSITTQPGVQNPYNNEVWVPSNINTYNTNNPNPGFNYASDLTWSYTGGPTISTPVFFLGQFTVETEYQDYTAGSPPIPIGSTISYTYSLDGGGSNSMGSGTLVITAPEPSSVVVMLTGVIALPYLVARRRRRL